MKFVRTIRLTEQNNKDLNNKWKENIVFKEAIITLRDDFIILKIKFQKVLEYFHHNCINNYQFRILYLSKYF